MKYKSFTFMILITLCGNLFGDFTIAFIPDTQHLSQSEEGKAKAQAQIDWIISEKETRNIVYVSHLGDVTESWNNGTEWQRMQDVYTDLYGVIPFGINQGNHDEIESLNNYFPLSTVENEPWFGGYFNGIENTYHYFTWEGMDFMIINIQTHDPFTDHHQPSIDWANEILPQNSDKRIIVVSHDVWETQTINTQVVSKYDNIFLAHGGHTCSREVHQIIDLPGGGVAHSIAADYQCDNPETGLLRWYTFKSAQDQICAQTYSPYADEWEGDEDSEFCFTYDMETPTASQKQQTFLQNQHLVIYHDPLDGSLIFNHPYLVEELSVVASNGRTVLNFSHVIGNQLNTSILAKGVYHLRVASKRGRTITRKIFKL